MEREYLRTSELDRELAMSDDSDQSNFTLSDIFGDDSDADPHYIPDHPLSSTDSENEVRSETRPRPINQQRRHVGLPRPNNQKTCK